MSIFIKLRKYLNRHKTSDKNLIFCNVNIIINDESPFIVYLIIFRLLKI